MHPSEDNIDTSPSKSYAISRKRKRPNESDEEEESEDDASSEDDFEKDPKNIEIDAVSESDSEADVDIVEESDSDVEAGSRNGAVPRTPRKKRRTTSTLNSPQKRRTNSKAHHSRLIDTSNRIFQTPTKPHPNRDAIPSPTKARASAKVAPTPHSKAALRVRQRLKTRAQSAKGQDAQQIAAPAFSYTDSALASLSKGKDAAQLRAMHVLHVGSRPGALPCREAEFDDILAKVLVLLEEGAGGCVCELDILSMSLFRNRHI